VYADLLLRLIAEQPDLTLDEIVMAMRKRRIAEAVAGFGASSSATISASKSLRAARCSLSAPDRRYRTLPSRGHRRPLRICRILQSDPPPQARTSCRTQRADCDDFDPSVVVANGLAEEVAALAKRWSRKSPTKPTRRI